jgi:murein DD-endopeptidase MepM/ murein hydrolase activator NlpD
VEPKIALSNVARWPAQHRKGLTLLVAAAFASVGAVAFAVAPLAPDAADLPSRWVTETLAPQLEPQVEALAGHDLQLYRHEVTRQGDSIETVLRRLGIARDARTLTALRADRALRRAFDGRPGRSVQASSDASGTLQELIVRMPADDADLVHTHFKRLTARPFAGRWLVGAETVPFDRGVQFASGAIRTTLFAATDEARLDDGVAGQLAEIFATEIDFHRELRRGDSFHLVFETLAADGEPVRWPETHGRVLAAELVSGGRTMQAVWFESDGKGAYFDPNGNSRKRTFLASPVEFTRMTSGFADRFHPLLRSWRQHNGVDYSAPAGTPVRSVGDGTVQFAGWQNGYGNVVEVEHGGGRNTMYAHLSRIDVNKGQRIQQGQNLGAVGATGWATGPHLHFEFRVGGVHQDPLALARAAEKLTLDPAARKRFAELAQVVQTRLDVAESLAGARSTFE